MAEELISSYIDQAAIKSQTDFLIRELERAKAQYKSLSDAIKNIKGSSSFADTSKFAQAAEKEQQALLKTQQQIIRAKQEQVKLENQLLQQQILQEKQAQANLRTTQAQSKVKKSVVTESITRPGFSDDLNKAGTVVSDFDKKSAEAAISATEFGNSLNKSAKVLKNEVIPAVKQTTLTKKQLALAQAEGKLLAQQEAAALKNQVREELAVKGSLEQRRAALIRLNAVYDNQSPVERASFAGQRLQKIISGLDTQVKTLESTTGRAQRNVGNYGSAFDTVQKGASKAFSVLRNLAYIIPGIGIAGIIGAIVDPVVSLTKNLLGFGEVSEKIKKQQETIATAFKSAADSVADEISKVTLLKTVLESDNATHLQKVEALKQLKSANVDYFGQLDIEDGKVKGLTTVYDAYITRLIRSINAKANVNLLTEALKEQANVVGTINKDLSVVQGKFTANNLTQFQILDAIRKFNLTFGAGKGQSTFLGLDQLQLIADLLNAESKVKSITDKIKGDVSDVFDPKAQKTTSTKTNTSKALTDLADKTAEEILKIRFDMDKRSIQHDIDFYKEVADNEKNSYHQRLQALSDYNDSKNQLINIERQFEIDSEELRYKEIEKNINAQNPSNIKGGQNAINEQLFREKQVHLLKLANIESKYYDEIRHQASDYLDYIKKVTEEIEKVRKAAFDEDMKRQEKYVKRQLDMLDEFSKKNELSWQKAAKKDIAIKNYIEEEKYNIAKQFAEKAIDLTQTLVDAGYTRQQNAIQKLIDANNKYEAAEISRITNSTVSEQEKAALIIQLNAKTAANNKQLEEEQRQVRIKQAQFDKAVSIAKITLNTAVAATNAATTGDPYTAALRAGIVIALGAAELAIALATPIPTYAEGTDNHPGGYMITGEGKYPELVTEPGKRPYIVDKATLSNAPAGTKVEPITDMLNQKMYSFMMRNFIPAQIEMHFDNKLSAIKDAIIEQGYYTQQAIKNQKKGNVSVFITGNFDNYLQKTVRN
jgi:hypothetical protein